MHPLIRFSIIKDDRDRLEKYFSQMPNSFVPSKDGTSPLMLAAQSGSSKAFKYLLEIGQDPNYTSNEGKSLKDFLHDSDVVQVYENFIKADHIAEPVIGEWENIQWEPEKDITPREQNKEDLARIQKLQEALNHAEIINTDTEWDASWIELPTYVDVRKQYLTKPRFQKTLRKLFRTQATSFAELKILTSSTPELYEPLTIALSCAGIQIDESLHRNNQIIPKEFDSSEYEYFLSAVDEIVSEEINQTHNPWFLMANQWGQIKKQHIDTSSLVKEADNLLNKIYLIFLHDINLIMLLLSLHTLPKKDELTGSLFDTLRNTKSTETSSNAGNISDENSTSNVEEDGFTPMYSVGKGYFDDETTYDKQESQKLLEKLEKSMVFSEALKKEAELFIKKTKPTAAAIERVCFELNSRSLNSDNTSQVIMSLVSLQAIRNKIAQNNLGLIFYILRKTYSKGVDSEDLFQEGYFGLLRAAEKFDSARGGKFSTYAVHWIHQAIRRYRDNTYSTIRYPIHFITDYEKFARYKKKLEDELKPLPTDQQIAESLGLSINVLESLKTNHWHMEPFDTLASEWEELNDIAVDEPTRNLMDNLPFWYGIDYSDVPMVEQLKKILESFLDKLPERNAQIMIRRFGLDGDKALTLEELGQIFDVTRERIRQIESKSLVKLRHPKYYRILRDFINWD